MFLCLCMMYVYTTHHSAILLQYYATYLYVTPRHTSTFTPYITTYVSTYNPSSTLLYYTPGLGMEPGVHIDYSKESVTYDEFINQELILFSHADNERSIPHYMDGFKPSQRKVLYACFKRNLKNEIKVAQLAGYISEHSAYHHGKLYTLYYTVYNLYYMLQLMYSSLLFTHYCIHFLYYTIPTSTATSILVNICCQV